jgi:Ca2+-binding EF-hand superfamily protein
MTKEETKNLKDLFMQIDKNNDGVLTKEEIKNGF